MAKPQKPMQTLKIAFLGGRGSGKTTLIASYLGHMASSRWQKEHHYFLGTPDSADSKRLNSLFQGLCDGFFPEATIKRATPYRFHMHVEECAGTPLEIQWLDYPGEWWDKEPADDKERKQRNESLQRMVNSQVCFLVIDGAELRRHGEKYLRAYLAHMTNEIVNQLQQVGPRRRGKKQQPLNNMIWILALSKADLFGNEITAQDFADFVSRRAGDQLDTLRQRLADTGRSTLGMNYLLFSSVLGSGQTIININRTIGLDLIAPLAIRSILERELAQLNKSAVLKRFFAGSADRGALQALFNLIRHWLAKWPDRPTRDLADLMFSKMENWVGGQVESLQQDLDHERQQGHTLEAATAILKLALSKPDNARYFLTGQAQDSRHASKI